MVVGCGEGVLAIRLSDVIRRGFPIFSHDETNIASGLGFPISEDSEGSCKYLEVSFDAILYDEVKIFLDLEYSMCFVAGQIRSVRCEVLSEIANDQQSWLVFIRRP